LPDFLKELKDGFGAMAECMSEAKKLCGDNRRVEADGTESGYYISRNNPDFIADSAREFGSVLEKWIKRNKDSDFYDAVNNVYSSIRKFVNILNYYDDKFMTYVEMIRGNVTLSLNCIDPSDILDGILGIGRASVMFSATLAPLSYFCDLLGGGKKPMCVDLASPYDSGNLCLAAVDTLSTRFEDRERSYKKIATCIAAAVSPKAGNYIAYFPSYGYLEKVYEAFVKKYPKVKTIVQKKGMSRAQHEEFINSFKDDENKLRIGFCVLGGSFSEGVDLPGNRLIGSIIVGVGLPGFSSERNIMRDYFENRYENGFEYAYTYPGMNNVLQAAGRVIRREDDKGIVVLIDDRYAEPKYRSLFPKHWSHMLYAGDAASLAEIIRRFWNREKQL
jgi:Rad3-related DNA helicase